MNQGNSSGAQPQQPQAQGQQGQQPGQQRGLIKPEQVQNLSFLSAEQKRQYTNGLTKLWQVVRTLPPADKQYQDAMGKIERMTLSFTNELKKIRMQQAQSQGQQQNQQQGQPQTQNQGQTPAQHATQQQVQQIQQAQEVPQSTQPQPQQQQPQSQSQPQQQSQQQPHQVPQAQQQSGILSGSGVQANANVQGQQSASAGVIPNHIRSAVASLQFLVPLNQDPTQYREEMKRRYAEQLWRQEHARAVLQKLQAGINAAKAEGKEPSKDLIQQCQSAQNALSEANKFFQGVKTQQNQLKAQQAALNANGNGTGANGLRNAANQAGRGMGQNVAAPSASPVSRQPSISGAASQQLPSTSQAPQPGSFQTPRLPNQQQGQGPFNQQSALHQQNNQQTGGPPVPFTHQGAIDAAARAYTNPPQSATQQPASATSQPNGQTAPLSRLEGEKPQSSRWPATPSFSSQPPQPPQPVSMGPSRPTMSGSNNGPMGMMGQPALQQPPPYELHGPGDRVLDKKKLDELVRQVCGVGDGANTPGLHPEVEEAILQLADEFFDNVVQSACRLAKLRGSATLEIRDIQLVLQRHYNIRIPGYATDEVRTVRKIVPTASYLQKMNAVHAAKVMGPAKGDM